MVWIALLTTLFLHHGMEELRNKSMLVHEECDSVAQVYRRLEILPPTHKAQMRLLLSSYLEAKLRKFAARKPGDRKSSEQELMGVHAQLYALTVDLVNRKLMSENQGLAMEAAMNRMISLHFRTDYALNEQFPVALLLALAAQAVIVSVLVGYTSGSASQRRLLLPVSFLLLTLLSAYMLWELNDATSGLVQADISNWRDLVEIMHQRE